MLRICIAYHSGYGHTAKVANSVAEGCRQVAGSNVTVVNVEEIENHWAALDEADAIIFGSPTYMGGVSAQFKKFIDTASGRWFGQQWKNKIAAGFTNSGGYSGDKQGTLQQLMTNALQHSMIWVGLDIMPPQNKGIEGPKPTDINRLGSSTGLMTQANNDTPDVTPPSGDLETAKLFGKRVAEVTARFVKGAA
jgi:NAD(P)H dehydrogenase (quinone)